VSEMKKLHLKFVANLDYHLDSMDPCMLLECMSTCTVLNVQIQFFTEGHKV